MNTWIFQANPSRYDLLADWSDGAEIQWAANQRRQEMQEGDSILFRLSGKKAGLYGIGTIISTCYEDQDEFGSWKVDVRYGQLIEPPILREETDKIAQQFNFKPLIGQEATNFLLPDNVNKALNDLIQNRGSKNSPGLAQLTSRQAVLDAVAEYNELGQETFLSKYGFGKAVSYVLIYEGREYDSKAIAGVAMKHQFGTPLSPGDFSGGKSTVKKQLESLGFMVRSSSPNFWFRDEVILALDLYLRYGALDDTNSEVQQLSQLLNGLSLHPNWQSTSSFRSPNSVSMKLQNLRALDPSQKGKGLKAASKIDGEVWDEFHDKPEVLAELAEAIRTRANWDEAKAPEDDEEEFPEGRILTRIHKSRERNKKLVTQRKLQRRQETGGRLTCEVCDFDFSSVYGDRGDGFAECHHKIPLAESGHTTTRLQDLAILCANCHRMIHVRKPTLSVEELRKIMQLDK